ncbi:MAG: hypothetical protein ABI461_05025, partial [Polyangiaceae bacterium]
MPLSEPKTLLSRLLPASASRILVAAGFAALAAQALRGAMPSNDIASVAAYLGDAMGGVVLPKDVHWEPSGGMVADYISGRWALFLGSSVSGAPRDLYRARVRLSPEGHPLQVHDVHDLTSTPLGDDHDLTLDGKRAAFATYAFGQEQSVSALDLDGETAPENLTLVSKITRFLTNVQETGTGSGIARTDVTLDPPATHVLFRLKKDDLDIAATSDAGPERADVNLVRNDVTGSALHVEPVRHLTKQPILWAVDTVRAVPWIGPAPIAWLEERVFWLKDAAKQVAFKLHGEDPADELKGAADPVAPAAPVLDGSKGALDDAQWPPENLASIWKQPEPGEGVWQQPKLPWMKH